jgi:hypothetical protein
VVSDFVESEWRVPADLSGGMLLLFDLLCSDSTKSETTKEEFKDRCNMAGNFQTMPDIQITENGVAKLLHHLNPHKSAGPDNITPSFGWHSDYLSVVLLYPVYISSKLY